MATFTPAWMSQLQPASFAGVEFVVSDDVYTSGRRVAIHEYPFRDKPWVEDLGLHTCNIEFSGYLCGDDCYSQRDQLKKALETSVDGTLVHPSLGSVHASLINASFSERAEKGRVVELRLQFVLTDELKKQGTSPSDKPTIGSDTRSATKAAVGEVKSAAQGDFFSRMSSSIGGFSQSVKQSFATFNGYVSTALAPLRDAARMVHQVTGIASFATGSLGFGRFLGGTSIISGPINKVLGGIGRGLSMVNRVESGVTGLLHGATQVTAGVGKAWNLAGSLLSKL